MFVNSASRLGVGRTRPSLRLRSTKGHRGERRLPDPHPQRRQFLRNRPAPLGGKSCSLSLKLQRTPKPLRVGEDQAVGDTKLTESDTPENLPEANGTTAVEGAHYTKAFILRRLVVFCGIIIGYSSYYLTRNSLNYAAPVMVADKALKITLTEVGAMTSVFPIFYGFSKFASGVLGAKTDANVLLAGGLVATAFVNIMFGFGASLAWFCVFWALNGMFQGLGGPCCARILTNWWASGERGTYWGMWNIAHNIGGFLAPIIVGFTAKQFGWRWGMWAPGIIGMTVGSFVIWAARDRPESLGFQPVEEPHLSKETENGAKKIEAKKDGPTVMEILVQNVLKNPYIWGMALTYFFIYVIRQGVTTWFCFFLIAEKGVQDVAAASVRVSGLELGGLAGSLLAGRFSDLLIQRSKKGEGAVGKRVQVVMLYTVGVAIALATFRTLPASLGMLQWINVFMIGFFLYGPQMLIGLCGAELVGKESVGASEGFLGWIAYLGAANAGIPLSIVVQNYGWNNYFMTLICACGMALLLLAPMINLKSDVQRQEDRLEAASV